MGFSCPGHVGQGRPGPQDRVVRKDDPTLTMPSDEWAEKTSTNILYAIEAHDGLISNESASSSDLASPGQRNVISSYPRRRPGSWTGSSTRMTGC